MPCTHTSIIICTADCISISPRGDGFIFGRYSQIANDTYGHEAGDKLLCEVARRLRQSVREGDTVARLGGDEFVVMLEDLGASGHEACERGAAIGDKILAVLNEPFDIDGDQHHTTPSIGVTSFGSADERAEDLLRRADAAMYRAKAAGRNRMETNDTEPV